MVMEVMTILGTRPEIIRLASVIKALDKFCKHTLVHTGQNYDYSLNKVFFEDLGLRQPDIQLKVKDNTIYGQVANIIRDTGLVLDQKRPDALLVLGDTNSALSVIPAHRLKIPTYHMEAGDRSFDKDVPEELNRRIVDHCSDILLAYTEASRRNLLREGIHPGKVFVTGSPIREVYESLEDSYRNSKILTKLKIQQGNYIAASIHREENVDVEGCLETIVGCFNALVKKHNMPIIVSTHPRTKLRLQTLGLINQSSDQIIWHEPFGLIDFLHLQTKAKCVVSDSGTIHEDSSVLGFPAVAIRKSTEKPESIDAGHCIITGLDAQAVQRAVDIAIETFHSQLRLPMPSEYAVNNVSIKLVKIILGMNEVVRQRSGIGFN